MKRNQNLNQEKEEVFIETTYETIKDFGMKKSDICYAHGKLYFKTETEINIGKEYTRSTDNERKKKSRERLHRIQYENLDLVPSESFEDNSMVDIATKDFIIVVNKFDPIYGKIFQCMYDGARPREIAEYLMIDVQTVYKGIRKIRKILQPLAIEWGFRPRR